VKEHISHRVKNKRDFYLRDYPLEQKKESLRHLHIAACSPKHGATRKKKGHILAGEKEQRTGTKKPGRNGGDYS